MPTSIQPYIPIHLHSEYSLLDGLGRIPAYAKKLKELNISACAISDHGVLYGAYEWYQTLSREGIKPILGMEGYLAEGSVYDRARKSYHLLLIASTQIGYQNLLKLSSRAFIEGFYYNPRFDYGMLEEFSEGLICTSACLGGPVANHLLYEEEDQARKHAKRLLSIFGPDRFFIEIQDHSLPDQQKTNNPLIGLAASMGLPLVCSNDTHYVDRQDAFSQDLLMCISTKKTLADNDRLRSSSNQMYLKSHQEMWSLFSDVPEAITNTQRIAEMCNVDLSFQGYQFPNYELPPGYTPESYMSSLVEEGAKRRYGYISEETRNRINYETSVVNSMGFALYFLVVSDFVTFARSKGILVGAGRGSAAGSILAYCLGITDVCPLKYDLIFERFLMPGRVGMPDIDIDFDSTRRQEVINYVVNKYGDDRVAQLATFGRLTAKAAIRDVGRAMGLSYPEVERVSNLVPATVNMNLTTAMETVAEMRAAYDSDSTVRTLIDESLKVEGLARHASTHAAALVISRDPLVEHVPLQTTGKNRKNIVTQYSQDYIEAIGLLKMDFLGLSALTVMSKAAEMIVRKDPGFRVDDIPLDDNETFRMLQRGEVQGLFQMEGTMNEFLIRAMAPTRVEDIMAQIALSRPGPRDLAMEYIERKHGRSSIVYDHPLLEDILKETYGILVYQEQVITVSNRLAGFTLTEGEGLRKVIAKKKYEAIYSYRDKFIGGCLNRGVSPEIASKVFDLVERFGWYALNKAHSAAYAVIGVQTAYIKCHYPLEFMAAWLTTEVSNASELTRILSESRRMGIFVLPPDINRSGAEFLVEGNAIRFGLGAIRNVGEEAVKSILSSREALGGRFPDLFSVCREIDWRAANKRTIENLGKSGALDCFGSRAQIMDSLDSAIMAGQSDQKHHKRGQIALFELKDRGRDTRLLNLGRNYSEVPKYTILAWERETIGVYLSEHPLVGLADYCEKNGYIQVNELAHYDDRESGKIIGIAAAVRKIDTKTGRKMAVVQFEDMTGRIELVVFPDTYQHCSTFVEAGSIINVQGHMDRREGKYQFIADSVSQDYPKKERVVHIKLPPTADSGLMHEVNEIITQFSGDHEVMIYFGDKRLRSRRKMDISDLSVIKLQNTVGRDNLKITA